MASQGERVMNERLRDPPRLELGHSDGEEEELGEDGVAVLAARCGGLTLAGGVEGGDFSLPGLGGRGGGGGSGSVGSAGSSSGGRMDARVEARVEGGGFKLTGLEGAGGSESVGLGGFGELGVGIAGCGGGGRSVGGLWDMGMAGGGDSMICLSFDGEEAWIWRIGPARMKLNVWGGIWDVGWNGEKRMGPQVMVGSEDGGSGGPPGPIG